MAYFVSHLEKIYHRVYGHETMSTESCDVLLSVIKLANPGASSYNELCIVARSKERVED